MSLQLTPMGTVLALLFAFLMGGLLWWMLHVPPPVPLEVARATRAVEAVRRILVPTVNTDYSRRGIELASRLGLEQKAEIVLVYVLEVPMTLPLGASLPGEEKRAAETLERARAIVDFHHLPSRLHLVRSRHAGTGILQALQEQEADLIVMGIRPRVGSYDLLGRTSEWLIKRSPCELIIDKLP